VAQAVYRRFTPLKKEDATRELRAARAAFVLKGSITPSRMKDA
jgi:hypothetical protein